LRLENENKIDKWTKTQRTALVEEIAHTNIEEGTVEHVILKK
jgi:hypothetical protein